MANPTTNYGWQMPTPTDLVTDLPADFEVFGQAVDTSLIDLKGGTTGQVLSKTTGTDMDFTWVTSNPGDITGVAAGVGISGGGTSGDVTVTNSMATTIDAKGDLIGGTADNAFARLAVGANNTILTADSTTATGMKWAAAAASAPSWSLLATQTTTTGTSYSITGLGGYDRLMIIMVNVSTNSGSYVSLQINTDTTTKYDAVIQAINGTSATSSYLTPDQSYGSTQFYGGYMNSGADKINGAWILSGCNSAAGNKQMQAMMTVTAATSNFSYNQMGVYTGTSAVSSIQLITSAVNFDAGTLRVYGSVV